MGPLTWDTWPWLLQGNFLRPFQHTLNTLGFVFFALLCRPTLGIFKDRLEDVGQVQNWSGYQEQ